MKVFKPTKKHIFKYLILGFCFLAIVTYLVLLVRSYEIPWHGPNIEIPTPSLMVEVANGAVAADNPICSQVGVDILKQDGHAVDAAVASSLCIGVVNMYSAGIGGGGFMLVLSSNGQADFFDYREVAPLNSSMDMFVGRAEAAVSGGLSVAVPGEFRELETAHKKYGRLSWKTVMQPSIDLARNGFLVHKSLAHAIEVEKSAILSSPSLRSLFAPFGELLGESDVLVQSSLADTLERVANEGVNDFYNGTIAQKIVKEIQSEGGTITLNDLSLFQTVTRQPLRHNVRGLEVLSGPPPCSGGVVIMQIFDILEQYPDIQYLFEHRLVEAMKFGFASRMGLGDPKFVNVSSIVSFMTDKNIASILKSQISDIQTYGSEYYTGILEPYDIGNGYVPTDHGTSHVSIVDCDRNAVSMTSTINTYFGSKVRGNLTGIYYNNQMDDFSIPGVANYFGLAPSEANYIRPGKKPLSSMSPCVVTRNNRLFLVAGASGGPKIITATLQVLLHMIWNDFSPFEAIVSPRLHHQLYPPTIFYEKEYPISSNLVSQLTSMGHNVTKTSFLGVCQAIKVIDGNGIRILQAMSDPRKVSVAAGY